MIKLFGLRRLSNKNPMEIVDNFQAEGKWREAIDFLSQLNREEPNPLFEQRLVELRLRAFQNTAWAPSSKPWPPTAVDPFSGVTGIPEISAQQLSVQALAGAVLNHGSLLVRGLVSPKQIPILKSDIDYAFEAYMAGGKVAGTVNPWLNPPDYLEQFPLGHSRQFTAETGGVWAADSPRTLFHILELYRDLNLQQLLSAYFGDTPCLSVRKWVLRKVAPLSSQPDWHQDASFMGVDVRSMNLWIALSDCGGDSDVPGLDIVPKRLNHLVERGTGGARFDWTVGSEYVEQNFRDTPPVRPAFKAGDALFFDHMNLHCTSYAPHMKSTRYAIECWFFAASLNATKQIPMFF